MTVKPIGLLAHQGGWDEMLMVAGPLLVICVLLWMANRRAERSLDASRSADGPLDDGDAGGSAVEAQPNPVEES